LEAYQRAQALVLLSDMANRITTNRPGAADYVTGVVTPIADDGDCPGVSNPPTRQELDMVQWCYRLLGAAEVAGGVRAGAMIGARGCVEPLGAGVFMVTVAWQGLAPISAPPASVACGAGSYDAVGAGCADDLCRRAVTTVVSIAAL
jgi:type IV pilus assembly protein PilV